MHPCCKQSLSYDVPDMKGTTTPKAQTESLHQQHLRLAYYWSSGPFKSLKSAEDSPLCKQQVIVYCANFSPLISARTVLCGYIADYQ